jgi:vacuolar protein sorting-associated protein 13A/C
LIQADIKIEGSTIFVHLGLAQDGWPIVIENESDYEVLLSQTVRRIE